MGRIIELLSEKVLPAGGDDTKAYLKNTSAGNLFRLMLVVNPDQPIVQLGSQNVVSNMLSGMTDKADAIKSLQTSFNKVKKMIVAGKRPTIALKKDYFGDLFGLLLPLTGQDSFKHNAMVASFSANTDPAVAFQRRAIVLIGKSLLANKDVEINAQDRMLIKGYIAGLDSLDGIEQEKDDAPENIEDIKTHHDATPVEVQPKNPVTKVVTPEKSLDEIKTISAQANKVVAGIKAKSTPNPAQLGEMLKTNERAEEFHVSLTGTDTAVTDVINSKISVFYHQTKLNHGVEVANFATKLMTDSIKHLDAANGYLNFVKGEVDFGIEKIQDGLQLSVKVGKSAAPIHQFFYENSFITDTDGKFAVHLDKIQIPAGAQSTGINRKIFKDTLNLYKAEGVDRITLEANVDVGGYAWFRYGFLPEDMAQIKKISTWMRAVTPFIVSALRYDSKDIAKFIDDKTYSKTKGVNNLVNLISGGDTPQSRMVIPKLFEQCAIEFENTFDNPAKFKELAKNIAVMNFKEYKIAGNMYSISYKAFLSIQSLNVNGAKPIPMVSGVHLNWRGVLDMKKLDDTYAYLGMKKA